MEVLLVILILATVFVSYMAVIGQALRIGAKSREIADAVSEYESFLFDIGSGLRLDLISEGGGGELENGFKYEIHPWQEKSGQAEYLKSRISWKYGREFLDFDLIIPEAAVQ